jgi:hypothetical protein
MPCGHVSESIFVRLDEQERLLDYAFEKETCGAPVGQSSLLLQEMKGKHINEIAEFGLTQKPPGSITSTKHFVYLKHFDALLQSVLTYMGRSQSPLYRLEHIDYSPEVTSIHGTLRVSIDAKDVSGCTKGCGSSTARPDQSIVQFPTTSL